MSPALRRALVPLVILAVAVIGFLVARGGSSADGGPASTAGAVQSAAAASRRTTPAPSARAHATVANPSGLAEVGASQLPPEARETLGLIQRGGPYPYSRDGIVYSNFEKILPSRASGYYHEYTVVTPGSQDRGARRIVAGDQGEKYYTDDHYASFRFILEGE
ncbi:ribonuclease [Sinomonas cellulolyticus]|uniref:Ribonuclease n=1 Tax=Sinomonas cellulolyticus TaxID=2801916 RepID=A0ABS1K2K1_9MICC|nr:MULTISPECIES: ribonuclease domain-containing protein [Sinomonas]MBL0705774.1 ribonuclease [Sinomonas cellulolyticus]GHG41930.1 ribonuclease [Sinomonas sp. KCTC 49339]